MLNFVMLWYSIPQPEHVTVEIFGYPWWVVVLAMSFCVGTFCLNIGTYWLESQSKVKR